MRSRALILLSAVSAAILIGCGGGGGGGKSTNTTGTTGVPGATQPGDSLAMVNLPAPPIPSGRLNVAYLPLQGRLINEETVTIKNIELSNGSDVFLQPLESATSFALNGNQVQEKSADVPVPDGLSRPFSDFDLNLDTLNDPADGIIAGTPDSPFVAAMPFQTQVRVFPSRESTLPIFLNDGMIDITTDPITGVLLASFDAAQFTAVNGVPIQGFISDFLAFDVSSMGANRPIMSNGQAANRVYFSGDKFALGGLGPTGYFEMLTTDPTHPHPGEAQDPVFIGTAQTPGIYRTLVPDPTDPTHTAQITELFGIFRFFVDPTAAARSTVINTGNFEVITLPKTPDDEDQQILLVALNGAKVTNMYWGDAHLQSGTFVAFPLVDLANGSAAGAIQGTLSGFLDANGSAIAVSQQTDAQRVHYGRYTVQGTLPAGFRSSGRFIVFRR